ncbi:hypothetical protein CEXT_211591 [Caerostris extrusa]|uniref:Uncharacterized protein n=1 Tax=Caerostris extrusa TaxID=172846 RepID=A0AAV4Q2K3_CAEEX|nr:hypothetical protein CEXT_211591 [Caerostris extrusa]
MASFNSGSAVTVAMMSIASMTLLLRSIAWLPAFSSISAVMYSYTAPSFSFSKSDMFESGKGVQELNGQGQGLNGWTLDENISGC